MRTISVQDALESRFCEWRGGCTAEAEKGSNLCAAHIRWIKGLAKQRRELPDRVPTPQIVITPEPAPEPVLRPAPQSERQAEPRRRGRRVGDTGRREGNIGPNYTGLCRGCGCGFLDKTEGCRQCYLRHYQWDTGRRKRPGMTKEEDMSHFESISDPPAPSWREDEDDNVIVSDPAELTELAFNPVKPDPEGLLCKFAYCRNTVKSHKGLAGYCTEPITKGANAGKTHRQLRMEDQRRDNPSFAKKADKSQKVFNPKAKKPKERKPYKRVSTVTLESQIASLEARLTRHEKVVMETKAELRKLYEKKLKALDA